MINCTFTGHRSIFHRDIDKRLENILLTLLKNDSAFQFFLGGMGEFDLLCAHALQKLKANHPEKQIRLTLVEPYMKQKINTEGHWLYSLYDDILIPEELAEIHHKRAIIYRNRWMINHSEYLIAYVRRDFGGAFATLQYAKSRNLTTILL